MDPITRFGERLRQAFEKGVRNKKLADVGGNFTISVFEKATWSVFTRGEKIGIVESATEDTMDFVMIMTNEVFEQMYRGDGGAPVLDVDQLLSSNKIAIYGDPEIFFRFLALNGAEDMLSLRAGNSEAKPDKKPTAKKRTRMV